MMFEEKDISISTSIIEDTDGDAILEISFMGIHNHHWPYGAKIQDFIEEEVRLAHPAAIIFNFINYHYEWGNEIAGPIWSACRDPTQNKLRPFVIVAEGMTAKRLKSLLEEGHLDLVLKFEFCENPQEAIAFLQKCRQAAF